MKKFVHILFTFVFFQNIQAQSVGGTTSGSSTYCDDNNSGFISLNGHNGNVLFWESSTDLILWTNLGNPTSSQSYFALSQTTHFRAIVQDGSFPQDTSTIATITINPPAVGGVINSSGTYCLQANSSTLTLSNHVGNVLHWESSIDNGSSWNTIINSTDSYVHPTITVNTWFRAILENIPGCPTDTSAIAIIQIQSASDAGILSANAIACIGLNNGEIQHTGGNGNLVNWLYTLDGNNWIALNETTDTYSYLNLNETTSYAVIVQNAPCPSDTSTSVVITIVEPEQPNAGNDASIMRFESTQLNGSGNGTPQWTPTTGLDNSNTFNPIATPYSTTHYILELTDANGCIAYDTVKVEVIVPIPDAITPNNDGVNDFFIIENIENMPANQLTIFNRNGMVVYQSSPYQNEWDGRAKNGGDLADGIYYYEFIATTNATPLTGYVLIKR
jgi:gliding motility-associated-like protein